MSSLKWLQLASVFLWGVPVASSLVMRLSKTSKWVWSWLLVNYCLFWDLERVRFCMPFKIRFYFLLPSGSHIRKPHWPSRPDLLEACLTITGPLCWGPLCWGARAQVSCSLGRTTVIVIILLFVGHLPGVWVLTIPHLCPSYSSCGSFFISLDMVNLFC